MRANPQSGFTLTELMIVVAIIAILAAIAVPSYTKYVRDARSSEAISNLAAIQTFEESYFSENNQYVTAIANPATFPFAGNKVQFNPALAGWADLGNVMPATRFLTFQYEVTAGQVDSGGGWQFCKSDGSSCTEASPDFAHGAAANCTKVGNTSGASVAVTNPATFGVSATPNSFFFIATAIADQDGDQECSLFSAITDRPDIAIEEKIE